MKKCTAIARKEIFYVVPFGPVAWLAGLVYINRVDARAAYKQISQAARIIDEIKVKGVVLNVNVFFSF
jgi:lysophosphatidate acyltransferase